MISDGYPHTVTELLKVLTTPVKDNFIVNSCADVLPQKALLSVHMLIVPFLAIVPVAFPP